MSFKTKEESYVSLLNRFIKMSNRYKRDGLIVGSLNQSEIASFEQKMKYLLEGNYIKICYASNNYKSSSMYGKDTFFALNREINRKVLKLYYFSGKGATYKSVGNLLNIEEYWVSRHIDLGCKELAILYDILGYDFFCDSNIPDLSVIFI